MGKLYKCVASGRFKMIRLLLIVVLFTSFLILCVIFIHQDPILLVNSFSFVFLFFGPLLISIPFGLATYLFKGLQLLAKKETVQKNLFRKINNSFKFIINTTLACSLMGCFIGILYFFVNYLTDKTAVGPGIAFSITSLIYGLYIAFVIYNPIKVKLENIYIDAYSEDG